MAEENTEQVPEEDESQVNESSELDSEAGTENDTGSDNETGAGNEAGAENDAADAEQPEPESDEQDKGEGDIPQPANEPSVGNEIPVVEPTRVSAADGSEITTPITDISMLLDIPVTLSMEIGQTRISISELLKLGKDSVIELQRMAHEPLDVLVNGTLVAHGEAVVVGDRFGIRLTDVISPQERLRKFGE